MCYPDKILRGISGKFVDEDGILSGEAFQLDDVREDGFCEISITWYENQESFDILMRQKKEGTEEIQFKYGAAEINRVDLDVYMKPHILNGYFKYERKPVAGNPYHGNFLVANRIDKAKKRLIKARLATLGNVLIHSNPFVFSD